MNVQLLSAGEVDFDVVVEAFNTGYEGYMLPIHVEADHLRAIIVADSIDLGASRVAFCDGRVAGVGLLAIRGKRGWVGGMGIAPGYRRQGIGGQVMRGLVDSARARRLETIQLEVINGNTAAHALYLKMGFKALRRLLVIEGTLAAPSPPADDLDIAMVPAAQVLQLYDRFHAVPNPWQRELATLTATAEQLMAWLAARGGSPLAYVAGRAGDEVIRLNDAAFAPGEADALGALVTHLHQRHPNARGVLVNLGEDDPAWPVLDALGYIETLSQFEMRLALT